MLPGYTSEKEKKKKVSFLWNKLFDKARATAVALSHLQLPSYFKGWQSNAWLAMSPQPHIWCNQSTSPPWPHKHVFLCKLRIFCQASQTEQHSDLLYHCNTSDTQQKGNAVPYHTPKLQTLLTNTSRGNDIRGSSTPQAKAQLKSCSKQTTGRLWWQLHSALLNYAQRGKRTADGLWAYPTAFWVGSHGDRFGFSLQPGLPEHFPQPWHTRIHPSLKEQLPATAQHPFQIYSAFLPLQTALGHLRLQPRSQLGLPGSQSLLQVTEISMPCAINLSSKWQEMFGAAKNAAAPHQLWGQEACHHGKAAGQDREGEISHLKSWDLHRIGARCSLFQLGWEREQLGGWEPVCRCQTRAETALGNTARRTHRTCCSVTCANTDITPVIY